MKKITKAMICNHEFETGIDLAYTYGVFPDGTPYEAELWTNEDEALQISFVLPAKKRIISKKPSLQSKMVGFHSEAKVRGGSALTVGMIDCGTEEDLSIIQDYVYKLEELGAVTFQNNFYNGYVWYLTDMNGNDLAEVIITLFENETEYAECHLILQEID